MAPASVPPPGSVSPNAPRFSPLASLGNHRARCSSVPNRKIGIAPSDTAASSVMATDESTRASSSIARHSAKKSPPMPPYCSGNGRPNRPILAIEPTMSYGNAPSSSIAAARGATTSRANSSTVERNASCSSSKGWSDDPLLESAV